jgi:hypothetical protein
MMDHVRYIDRTREDYIRQGYEKPYEWAHFDEVPFTPLKKPLSQCRVGLLGTSEVAVRFDPATEQNPISEEDLPDPGRHADREALLPHALV